MTNPKPHKALTKANSPVKKTGQGSALRKRLLKADTAVVGESREKILIAARACFAKQGFAGTSIKDIQEAAGFSRGNLYHHFKTKEDIVHTIIRQNLGKFCDHVELILKELDERNPSLADVIRELASLAEEITKGPGKGMAFHVWSLAMVEPEVRATMTTCFERIRSALEKKIVTLMDKGEIKKAANTEQLSVTLFGLVIPAFTLQSVYMDDKSLDAAAYTASLAWLFKNGS